MLYNLVSFRVIFVFGLVRFEVLMGIFFLIFVCCFVFLVVFFVSIFIMFLIIGGCCLVC